MSTDSTVTTSNTLSRFHYLTAGEFTGVLTIQATQGKWAVLFSQGQIVWAIDCIYTHRFWQRQLLANLPTLTLADLALVDHRIDTEQEIQPEISWPYLALVKLYLEGQIDSQQLQAVLTDCVQDVIFDILQAGHTEKLTYRSDNWRFSHKPPITVVFGDLMTIALNTWKEWQDSGLTYILPDYIPAIDQSTALYQQTTTAIHKNLAKMIDSQRSLREIAIKQRQDLLLLTRSLVPHLKRQIISLHPIITDIPKPLVVLDEPVVEAPPLTADGLVVYIDDNARANQHMSDIITHLGYEFFGVEDAANALELLADRQPNLIIMESAMSLTDSRHICQQLHRHKHLAKVPIVLLVDHETLSEHILAKLAGAKRIVTYPLDQDKVSELIRDYLGQPPAVKFTSL